MKRIPSTAAAAVLLAGLVPAATSSGRPVETPGSGCRARPLVLAAVLAAFVLVLSVAPAHARAAARPSHTAAACSKITVNGGSLLGTLHVRFVLVGPVSCAKAHSLARTWLNRLATGRCGQLNNFCVLHFRGGWTCSAFSEGESQTAGGATAGCARPKPAATIRLYYKVHPPN